jgi:hypothetical protein
VPVRRRRISPVLHSSSFSALLPSPHTAPPASPHHCTLALHTQHRRSSSPQSRSSLPHPPCARRCATSLFGNHELGQCAAAQAVSPRAGLAHAKRR